MPQRLWPPLQRPGLRGLCRAIGYVVPLAGLLSWAPASRAQTDEIQVYDAEITAPGQFNLSGIARCSTTRVASGCGLAASPRGTRSAQRNPYWAG